MAIFNSSDIGIIREDKDNTANRETKMTTATTRAAKGGEFGANGEWYEGGKFINTVAANSKKDGSNKKTSPRKVQIEPYVWVVSSQRPLFSIVGTGAEYCDRYNPTSIQPYMPAFENGVMCNGATLDDVQTICDRYNKGERFHA